MSDLPIRDALLSSRAGVDWPAEPLLDLLDISPGSAVLEVGAGNGRLLRRLMERGHTGPLEGLDLQAGPGVRSGDAHALPWPAATFDTVLLVRVLTHLARPAAALQEAWRVLRPGGLLVVAAHGPDHLSATWAAAGRPTTRPVASVEAPPVLSSPSLVDLRLPVLLTHTDRDRLVQSYGSAMGTPDGPEVLADLLHLRAVRYGKTT
ncbi:class I SAM-dependent methyltransferase [uncultured Deinococcus sp.]|uniref:class I SAM-dependent methyltransferase n=1 Tax=uncultured Deinococcus sp. TaxID=158789 RepID=UPI003747DF92